MTQTLLSEATLRLLHDFLTTRHDVLCWHLAEEDSDLDRDGTARLAVSAHIQAQATEVVDEVRQALRWAAVDPALRPRLLETIRLARSMWQRHGLDHQAVRHHVTITTPAQHVEFVLQEAYRGSPEDPGSADAEFEVAFVAAPAGTLRCVGLPLVDDLDLDLDVAAERVEDEVETTVRWPKTAA